MAIKTAVGAKMNASFYAKVRQILITGEISDSKYPLMHVVGT